MRLGVLRTYAAINWSLSYGKFQESPASVRFNDSLTILCAWDWADSVGLGFMASDSRLGQRRERKGVFEGKGSGMCSRLARHFR